MEFEKARVDFVNLQKRLSAFGHATALIYFDGETSAPSDTADNRAQSLQILNEEIFKLKTGPETVDLLEYLNERRDELTVKERKAVDFMLRELHRKKDIPQEEYIRYETLLTEAQYAWHNAREEDDYSILAPKLDEVINTQRNFAEYCAPGKDPYDYWLDSLEEGLDIATCDAILESIRDEVTPLLQAIMEKPEIDDKCLKGDFSTESQEDLAVYVMELLGLNMNRVGLATAEHPFTTFLGSHFDERIATRYSRKNYASSLYTVLNQTGHVLYETGQADNLAYTVLDGSASMGLLECQGRFYENNIGRSRAFIEFIYPELEELFPDTISGHTPEDIYRAVNKVRPGLIRIDADEVTFNLHIIVRYELEKAMMHRDLATKDLADAWREKYKEYLNLDVKDDVNGVLQDIHWPFGATGYFPIYVLGNAFAAQLADKMSEEFDIQEGIREGNYGLINLWNREHIWKHGGLYTSKEIMERKVGVEISSGPYIKYLKEKYTDVYGL